MLHPLIIFDCVAGDLLAPTIRRSAQFTPIPNAVVWILEAALNRDAAVECSRYWRGKSPFGWKAEVTIAR